jgi:hypothetical protein
VISLTNCTMFLICCSLVVTFRTSKLGRPK